MRGYSVVYSNPEEKPRKIEVWYSRYGHNHFDTVVYFKNLTDEGLQRFLEDIPENITIKETNAKLVRIEVF